MKFPKKSYFWILCCFAFFLLMALAFLLQKKKTPLKIEAQQTSFQKAGFDWYSYDAALWARVTNSIANQFSTTNVMALDLTFLPQHKEQKLLESIFVIESFQSGFENMIYCGPFRSHLILESVPYIQNSLPFVSFWAFHEESKTCLSWHSKDSSPLFIGKPLKVELYDSFNREADASFKIYPTSILP